MFTRFLLDHISDHRIRQIRRMRNSAPPVADQGGPGASPPPSNTPPPASTPGTTAPAPGTTPTPGSTPGPSADEIPNGDWKQLRERYDAARTRASLLDSLGIPETELPDVAKQWTGIKTEFTTLARELGYTDEADLAEAFKSDPIRALSILRQEKQEAAARSSAPRQGTETQAEYDARIQAMVDKATKPFTEHINKQISDTVTAKIGTEFNTSFAKALPDAPAEVRSLVEDYVIETLMHDNSAIVAMKARGDYTRVDEIVKLTAGRLKSVMTAWVAAERGRAGGRQTGLPPANQGTTRPTLDQMIENPGLIDPKYA